MDKEKIKKEFFEKSEKAGREEAVKVLENEDNIFSKIIDNVDLSDFIDDVKVFFSMIKDFVDGNCDIPIGTIGAISIALLYVLNPLDVIPDALPVVGYVDDALVLKLCLDFVKSDIEDYKRKCLNS